MNSRTLFGWFKRTKQFLSSKSNRTCRSPAKVGRRLTVESLEGRELMAVATLDRTFKDYDFGGTIAVSGFLSGSFGTQPVNGNFKGNLTLGGDLQYSTQTAAAGQGTATGTVTSYVYGYGNLPVLNLNGSTAAGGATEVNGKFSATLPAKGQLGEVKLAGMVNTKDWSATGTIQFTLNSTIKGNGTWTGKLPPASPQPLDVNLRAQWDPAKFGTVDVQVTAGGDVQSAVSRTSPVAMVNIYWADGTGKTSTKLTDTIPVLWNQATGSYELSKLPTPPASAAKLAFVISYPGTSKTVLLDLPPRPTLSISNITVTPPKTGTGDALFTVTLSGNSLAPVTVKYATVDGSAVNGNDYTKKSGTLTFKPGGSLTQTIAIKVKNDNQLGPQAFSLVLSAPTWATIAGSASGVATVQDPA